MKKILAGLCALGMALGIYVGTASATIGPFGGRYLTADPATKIPGHVQASFYIQGNGGNQTVDLRLRRFANGLWSIVNTQSYSIPSGNVSFGQGFLYPCSALPAGTFIYQTQAKWSSYPWSQADSGAGKNITCP